MRLQVSVTNFTVKIGRETIDSSPPSSTPRDSKARVLQKSFPQKPKFQTPRADFPGWQLVKPGDPEVSFRDLDGTLDAFIKLQCRCTTGKMCTNANHVISLTMNGNVSASDKHLPV